MFREFYPDMVLREVQEKTHLNYFVLPLKVDTWNVTFDVFLIQCNYGRKNLEGLMYIATHILLLLYEI